MNTNDVKYYYNGMSLREYCKNNNLAYNTIGTYVRKELKNGSTKTIEELVDEKRNNIKKRNMIGYYYKGIPLKKYCEDNNLNYVNLLAYINKYKRKNSEYEKISDNEIVDKFMEIYKPVSNIPKFYYNNIPLKEYCKSKNLNYQYVCQYIKNHKNEERFNNLNEKEIINKLVEEYKPVVPKYYYNGMTLKQYCEIKKYDYSPIIKRIRYSLSKNNDNINLDEIINAAIKKYENKKNISETNKIIEEVKTIKKDNTNEILKICNKLKINLNNVMDIMNYMNLSYMQTINIIWYFHDNKDENNFKKISYQKLKDIFLLINKVKKQDIEEIDVYDLIGLYKSQLYDTRNEILLKFKNLIFKTIYTTCRDYNIKIDNYNIEEFEEELKLLIIILIEKSNINDITQIIKYVEISVKGYFKSYIKKYKKNLNMKHNFNSKNDLEENNQKNYEINNELKNNLIEALSQLTKEELIFISLRYKKNLSYEALAKYYKVTLNEIKEKETNILSKLRNNNKIKKYSEK